MVSAPVGVDDEIGGKVAARRLDQDVDLGCISGSAGRIADDPAHGVARRDWSRADQLLARLKRDVGDLAGRSIDLIECAFGPDEPLHGVDEAVAARLDSRGLIRRSHPGHGSRGLAGRAGAARSVGRSEEHTSELQSLMRISYAVFWWKKKK